MKKSIDFFFTEWQKKQDSQKMKMEPIGLLFKNWL